MTDYLRRKFALEAIDFQGTGLFDALTEAFGKLRNSKVFDTKAIKAVDIPGIVFSWTGMTISFDIVTELGLNAMLLIPGVDKNHPFIDNEYRSRWSMQIGPAMIRAMGGAVHGSVNLETGKVSGIYSKIQGDIVMGSYMLSSKIMSDKEIAAIMCHEVGHLFTYFELMRQVVRTSAIISATAKACVEIDDPKVRLDCLKAAEEVLGIDVRDADKIANSVKAVRNEYVQTILITNHAAKARSESGLNMYDYRSCEQIADQWAQRQGAGAALVTGLDKIYRLSANPQTLTTPMWIIMEVMKLIGWLVVNLFTGFTPLLILVFGVQVKIYDDPKDRIIAIRRQMNDVLKDDKLPAKAKQSILDDIEQLKEVEKTYNDRQTLFQWINANLNIYSKATYDQQKVQKELETLLNSDLYAQAAALSLLK